MSIFLSDNYGKNDPFFQQRKEVEKNLENVKTIIAVHSGKGGVGKSTFSINFAAALSKKDFQVGLLDADLDCPSLHLMSGINDRVLVNEFGRFIPLTTSFGLKVISVGNMVESNSIANIMRGPIMFKLIFDMLSKTEWQNLDFLIIDLPPGTNDNPLTIMQLVNLDGLIIVTQPQKAALFDAEKSFDMAKKMNVRVLGVVENMSSEIFGQGTAREIASKYRIPFLGTILLDKRIRETSDKGLPAVLEYQDLLENFEVIIKNLNENLLKFRKQ